MTDIAVNKISKIEGAKSPIREDVERMLERIRERAFGVFTERGHSHGRALDDWLAAERELCWSAAELVERDKDYALAVALAGFEPSEIRITATPRELIVHAQTEATRADQAKAADARVRWSEFRSNDVYRRIEWPAEVAVDKISATLSNGLLKIVAPKARQQVKPVAVPTAA